MTQTASRAPTPKELAFARDQGQRVEKAKAQRPSLADYKADPVVGPALQMVSESEDGQIHARVVGREANARLMEMQNGWRREEIERGAALEAGLPHERVVDRAGRVVDYRARAAAKAGAAGKVRAHLSHGRPVLMARSVAGDWCEGCDRRIAWCECNA